MDLISEPVSMMPAVTRSSIAYSNVADLFFMLMFSANAMFIDKRG
jgi:hypothetical protein